MKSKPTTVATDEAAMSSVQISSIPERQAAKRLSSRMAIVLTLHPLRL
jgi:hypothetical protein